MAEERISNLEDGSREMSQTITSTGKKILKYSNKISMNFETISKGILYT